MLTIEPQVVYRRIVDAYNNNDYKAWKEACDLAMKIYEQEKRIIEETRKRVHWL